MKKIAKTISAWSFSALSVFEQCKFRSKLARIDKIPEPDRGEPPARYGGEWPNDRGNRVHDECENYVRDKGNFPKEAGKFSLELDRVRELFRRGMVVMEDMWCFDVNWCVVASDDYANIWTRIKLDVAVFMTDEYAVAIDYKTGKRFGNEVKHAEQVTLYALAMFLRYPKLQKVTAELWYLDQDELSSLTFTRKQALRFFKGFNTRGLAMTTCVAFPPNANSYSCKWCPYGPANSGDCKVGVQ